jgi:signal transduction histidine kinase
MSDIGASRLTFADALLHAYAEASEGALLAATADGAILSHSERFQSMWGIPSLVLAARSLGAVADWLHATGEDGTADLARSFDRNDASAGEVTRCDGRVIAWRSVAFRATDSPPEIEGRVWAFRDITTVRQTASSLSDAENWLRMFEAHTDGIVLEVDADVRIVGIWATKTMFFERPDSELQGHHLTHALGPAAGAAFDGHIRRVLATGEPESFEYVLDSHDKRRVFAANAVLLPGDDRARRVTVLIRDVTAGTRIQHQLLQAERLASVGLLAAGIAHEINNPLAYVLLHLERLRSRLEEIEREASPEDELSRLLPSVEICIEGSQRVHEIVYNLRRVSHSDPDEAQTPIDVERVLTFALAMAAPLVRRRATVVCDFGSAPLVLASEGRLNQIFLNLIVNAAHAIPEGSPNDNEIRVVTNGDAHGNVVIEVHDTGVGIPAGDMQRIFDPFFTTKAPGEGTGLGLAICHGITTSLGGSITAESHVGVGSVFRVVLPGADRTG